MKSLAGNPGNMGTILFVCYGNICRSPMAEFLFERLALANGVRGIRAASAGLHAVPGNQSPPEAVKAMAELGVDMSGHRARPVLPSMDSEYDLILAMDRHNLRELNNLFPHSTDKTGLLSSFAKRSIKKDILDPYGGPLDDYRYSRDSILTSLRCFIDQLITGGSV